MARKNTGGPTNHRSRRKRKQPGGTVGSYASGPGYIDGATWDHCVYDEASILKANPSPLIDWGKIKVEQWQADIAKAYGVDPMAIGLGSAPHEFFDHAAMAPANMELTPAEHKMMQANEPQQFEGTAAQWRRFLDVVERAGGMVIMHHYDMECKPVPYLVTMTPLSPYHPGFDREITLRVSYWLYNPNPKEDMPTPSLHQHRPAKKGCGTCGAKDLFWAHDLNSPTGENCERCSTYDPNAPTPSPVSGKLVLTNQDGSLHSHDTEGAGEADPWTGETDLCGKPETAPVADGLAKLVKALKNGQTEASGDGEQDMECMSGDDHTHPPYEKGIKELAEFVAKMNAGMVQLKREIDASDFKGGAREITITIPGSDEVRQIKGTQHRALPNVIKMVAAKINVLLTGPAGTGKSYMTEQVAEALDLPFYNLSLSPQTMVSQVFGYMQAQGKYVRSLFREAYENGGVFHFDEFDNAHPAVLAAINDGLANHQLAFPDGMVEKHPSFRCVASANTYGRGPDRTYSGRQGGDAATWDRFTVVFVDYDRAMEMDLASRFSENDELIGEVLRYVHAVRTKIKDHHLPVVLSPRATMDMVKMFEAGIDYGTIIDSRVRRGLSDGEWGKITAGVRPIDKHVLEAVSV